MRHSWLVLVLFGSLLSVACGPGQVNVTAEIEIQNPEGEGMVARPIADAEIQVLPFDRDAVFDSLTRAFGTPEPPIPDDLLEAQRQIGAAQEEWRNAEAAWGAGRDRLQSLVDEMEGLNPAEGRYVALFREWQDLDRQVASAARVKDRAFQTFTDLQAGYIQRADSMRFIREQWADEAYAPAFEVFLLKAREAGEEIVMDTTDAEGMAIIDVPPGTWWVYAFYDLPYS
ncbi:hypothetical protein ACFL5A_03250, partial [Gemmatimonadota bacterium]